jgi:hypothetical protein
MPEEESKRGEGNQEPSEEGTLTSVARSVGSVVGAVASGASKLLGTATNEPPANDTPAKEKRVRPRSEPAQQPADPRAHLAHEFLPSVRQYFIGTR